MFETPNQFMYTQKHLRRNPAQNGFLEARKITGTELLSLLKLLLFHGEFQVNIDCLGILADLYLVDEEMKRNEIKNQCIWHPA